MVLYTIGCPACNVLESKLKAKNIEYDVNTSEQAIRDLGFDCAPLLQLDDGSILNFAEAIKHLNNTV